MTDPKQILEKLEQQLADMNLSPHADNPPPYEAGDTAHLDALEKTLGSPETQKTLKDEIEKLGTVAEDVDVAFRNVSRGLAKVVKTAKEQSDAKKTKALEAHKSKWDSYQKTYVDLVWESRRVAGNARTVALDFAGDFIDVIQDAEYSLEDKKLEIEAYRKELDKDKKHAEGLAQGFISLHDGVMTFRKDLNEDLKTWAQEATQKVNKLLDEIEKVEKTVAAAKKRAIKAAMGGTSLGAGAGVLTALGFFCPALWIGSTALLGLAAKETYRAYKNYCELADKRNGLKQTLEEQTQSAEKVSQIIASTGNLENDVEFIQQKLQIFASVWTIIHADLNALEKELNLASNAQTKIRFSKKMNTVSAAYRTLALALRLYETNVHLKQSE